MLSAGQNGNHFSLIFHFSPLQLQIGPRSKAIRGTALWSSVTTPNDTLELYKRTLVKLGQTES
jgi:hypothetical protein